MGGRSTAISLKSGVWVLASTNLDAPTKARLDEMGTVRYIVAGNTEHNMFLGEFKQAYPQAKLIGNKPLLTKRKDLKFDGAFGADPPDTKYGFEDEIEACYFPETANNEVAYFHKESKTLIQADLLFNLKGSTSSLFSGTVGPYSGLHKKFSRWNSSDHNATKEHVKTVIGWDFDRIIPCHGEVIETEGKEAWKSAYEAFLN